MSEDDRQTVLGVTDEVIRALIPAATRAELERRVCEQFAGSDRYAFAWVGRYSPSEETVTPTTAAGIAADALDEISLGADSPRQNAISEAVSTRDVQVEQQLLDDPPGAAWGDRARDRDYQSAAVVPLVHEDVVYGVLYLAANGPDGFGVDERNPLLDLGETIAYAFDDAASGDTASDDVAGVDSTELEHRERTLRKAYEIITATDQPFSEQIDALLEVVREAVGTEFATFSHVTDDYRFEAVATPDGADLEAGDTVPLEELPNCRHVVESEQTLVLRDVEAEAPELVDPTWGISCYVGAPVFAGDEVYGTFCFYGMEARAEEFSDWEVSFVELLGDWVSSELGRREHERELEQYKAVAETASDVIVSIDERSRVQSVNPAVENVFGYEPDELVDEPLTKLMPESMRERHRAAIQQYLQTGERTLDWEYLELPGKHREGHEIPLSVSFSEYEYDGEQFFTGIIRDNTERKRFERALTSLHDTSRDLIQAETKLEVSERTVDAAREVLDLEGVGVYLFDDEKNSLRPVASTDYLDDIFGGLPTFTPEDTAITWTAFIEGETVTFDDVLEASDVHRRDTPLRSGIWIPLSDHGVLAILSEEVGDFDEQSRRLADHLAATTEATLDRVEREESLREQESTLAVQNRRLEGLRQMNDIIREIDQMLVEATTREEIERAVCGLLIRDDRFAFAWVGEHTDGTVTPRTWAGTDQGYLDAVSLTAGVEEGDPAVTTATTGDPTLVSNVAANLGDGPWRKAALARDLQSVISIPLRYNDIDYGVLTVYATQPDAFDDLSQGVLQESGETIANAMNFIDTRQALFTDSVVELELAIHNADDPLVRLARETGAELEFQGIVPQVDTARIFVTASGVDPDTVRAVAAASTGIEQVTLLGEDDDGDENREDGDDETRFEIEVSGTTIPAALAEAGAVVQTVEISDTETSVVVELPQSIGVRTFVDRLEEWYPETELVARRDRERADNSQDAFETALTETLTRRQLETLQTAYHSGYFEWPRDRTGEEVAEALGITQPTFNGHLRTAERKLCAMLFEGVSTAHD